MKRVTAFVGGGRKHGLTATATARFLDILRNYGEVETEIVTLSECNVGVCRGCKACFEKGEENCQFKDDRDMLMEKMASSDGVVFATPNYSFQVSAVMKTFLDRLGFVFHRPRYFGKTFTSIVAQGIYGGEKVVKYFDFVGAGLGFNVVKGSCVTALEPMVETERRKIESTLAKHARRYYKGLMSPTHPKPRLAYLMAFRMSRTSVRLLTGEGDRDYDYYRQKGWFESDYYYPVRLGLFGKAAGLLFDWFAERTVRKRGT